jgi:predicted naringenin-chalcone synthase
MKKEKYIHSFKTVFPKNHLPQKELVTWILRAHSRSESFKCEEMEPERFNRLLDRFALNEKFISKRYFECNEVDENWESHEIYRPTKETPSGANIETRNLFFSKRVTEVFGEMYPDEIPEKLIHVTCTGYVSPSPPQNYFGQKDSAPEITHAYHMGCYASLPAVRMALGMDGRVDVVHTELCGLHFDPSLHTPEQVVVQTLFADGHIKYSVNEEIKGMRVLGILEKLLPHTSSEMTWVPGPYGMKMTLSREVPGRIKDSLPEFINALCEKAQVKREEILSKGIFAIHPGGPKIIEAVQSKLELQDHQTCSSKEVLFERGNMSSATLPHVWQKILDSRPPQGTKVVSLAFGPGLTIFGSIFEVRG